MMKLQVTRCYDLAHECHSRDTTWYAIQKMQYLGSSEIVWDTGWLPSGDCDRLHIRFQAQEPLTNISNQIPGQQGPGATEGRFKDGISRFQSSTIIFLALLQLLHVRDFLGWPRTAQMYQLNETATKDCCWHLFGPLHMWHDSYANKARTPTGAFPNLGWYQEHILREAGTSKLRFLPWWWPNLSKDGKLKVKPGGRLLYWQCSDYLTCQPESFNKSCPISAVLSTCHFAAKVETSNAHIKGLRHLDSAHTFMNRFEQQALH